MSTNMGNPQEPPRKEVTSRGKLLSFSIVGTAMVISIFLENSGKPENIEMIPYVLLGALALSVAVPMLFFRRVIR